MVILPFSLLTAFLALMLKLTLNLSAFVLALPMLYIFGCGLYAAGLRCWIYSVKTQSYSLPVTASKSTPCFCCPVFSGGERQSFLLETVRGYDIIRMDRKITFEQL